MGSERGDLVAYWQVGISALSPVCSFSFVITVMVGFMLVCSVCVCIVSVLGIALGVCFLFCHPFSFQVGFHV